MIRRLMLSALPFALAAAILGVLLAEVAHATPPAASPAWINVVAACGADPTDTTNSTSDIQTCIGQAVTGNYPLYFPSGKYKVSSLLTIDYAGQAGTGFRLISDGATLDGRTVASGPVLQVECSGGSPSSPTACFYFHEEGSLFVLADTPAYAFVLGLANFADQHNSFKIDHLLVNNSSTNAAAGACQFNAVYDSDIFAVCDTAGGAAGIALEQVQFSRISGAGSANGTGGRAMVLENGYSFSNTIFGFDFEASPTCLSVTNAHNGNNTWISPYFNCTTAINGTGSNNNVLINPQYASVTNYGPISTGFTVIGQGSRLKWLFPTASSYTAVPVDDRLALSSYNATGASLAVTLPAMASINTGWSMGFASDNGKGMTIAVPDSAHIVYGNKSLASITLGSGNYEYVRLEADGNNWRVLSMSRNTALFNGFQPPPWPSNWLYPSTSGYTAQLGDDGEVLSSYNTSAGLTVTLPATSAIPNGWSMGFATDNTKGVTINVADGHIVWPGSGATATSVSLANTSQGAYEFLVLQYDNSGSGSNFRVIDATPATWQALGALGSAGISHWSFPTGASAYAATIADNGNVISAYNSTAGTLTVTLPTTTGLPMGWTIGLTNDNGKIANVQVNATAGGHILFPGSGATVTSEALAAGNYEFMALRYDGTGFRVTNVTPATATFIGMTGANFSINRWNFPSAATYVAAISDGGNALSSYNTSAGLSVTLPATSTIYPGWTMGFSRDNGKTMEVAVNGGAGEKILMPEGSGGNALGSVTLASSNYEFMQLRWDGSNYRIVSLTPATGNNYGTFKLPTSCTGMVTGTLWNNANVVNVCP